MSVAEPKRAGCGAMIVVELVEEGSGVRFLPARAISDELIDAGSDILEGCMQQALAWTSVP